MQNKKRRSSRARKAARQRRKAEGKLTSMPTNGSAPRIPAGPPPEEKLVITEKQRLAAEVMSLRSQLQKKTVAIAGLYDEINELRKQVLQGGVDAEARENQITAEKYNLPVKFSGYGRAEDGTYFVTCDPAAIPKAPNGKQLELPEEGAEGKQLEPAQELEPAGAN